jgi:signal transduction histidine kinase
MRLRARVRKKPLRNLAVAAKPAVSAASAAVRGAQGSAEAGTTGAAQAIGDSPSAGHGQPDATRVPPEPRREASPGASNPPSQGAGASPAPGASTSPAPDASTPPAPGVDTAARSTGPGTGARTDTGDAVGRRRTRVRNRLLVSVVICALTVIGAGTPSVLAASDDVSESQHMVGLAGLNKQTVGLSHALADERDAMVAYVAAGRSSKNGAGLTESQRSRVDRQILDVHAEAPGTLRRALDALPRIRQRALAGHGSALDTFDAYSAPLKALQRVDDSLARSLPPRAEAAASPDAGTADALPQLGRATQQASATRALLRAALLGTGTQHDLMAEAQRSNVAEQAAIADFHDTAGPAASDTYDKTVTGTDVSHAESYLARLTDQPFMDSGDRALSGSQVASALASRVDQMRGVRASFATDEAKRLEKLRDDDVTTLELRITLVVVFMLIAAGISVQTARSMARPLSVLTRGSRRLAADPTGKPVEFQGRNDEFAQVVRSLNQLRQTALRLRERLSETQADNSYLAESREGLIAERDRLRAEYESLSERAEATHGAATGTYVNLGMRTLGLVERQLGVIEGLEDQESDPDQLSTLFKLDHLATRMRRHSENLLLLAGAESTAPQLAGPVPLLDVLRAAISEIEGYERAALGTLPPHIQVSGYASDDLSHLVAELLDNATAFSAPDSQVRVSGWLLENGEVMLSVEDEGIGLTSRRLSALNTRLSAPDEQQPPGMAQEPGVSPPVPGPAEASGSVTARAESQGAVEGEQLGMGLYVVARLAARHGLRVQLRSRKQGGIAAVVAVPSALLPARPAPAGAATTEGTERAVRAIPSLPGTVAETNSNALPKRRSGAAASAKGAEEGPRSSDSVTPDPVVPDPVASDSVASDSVASAPASHAGAEEPTCGTDAAGEADRRDGPEEPSDEAPVRATSELNVSDDPLVAAAERAISDSAQRSHVRPPEQAHGAESPSSAAPTRTSSEVPEPRTRMSESAYPLGDDAHEHAPDDAVAGETPSAAPAADQSARPADDSGRRVTDKGLPKRTPVQVETRSTEPLRRPRQAAKAEELRRRLGGFHQGAQEGRREAEAEAGTEPGAGGVRNVNARPGPRSDGGNAEEART